MKKIIAILVAAMLLVTSLLVAVPASAAAVKTYNVNWSALDYDSYGGGNGVGLKYSESDYEEMFEVTKTENSITSKRVMGQEARFYVATTKFALTDSTEYEYVFKVKNNTATYYAGMPYAISGETVYMIYGSFNNTSDDYNGQKSELRFSMGSFDWEYPSTSNRTFPALDLDSQGYSTIKVVYSGFTAKIYGLVGGSFVKQGQDIELPSDAYIALGVYSRDADGGKDRTLSVKDAVVSGMNQAAADNMIIKGSNGASALKDEVTKIEREYLEVDYTAESYAAVKSALETAKTVANDANSTADDVNEAKTALQDAVLALELKEADTTKLEEAIAKAEALKEVEWTDITYKMVTSAVNTAKALLDKAGVKQSEIDAATSDIEGRIDALVPSGEVAEPEGDEGDATDAPADGGATDAPATQAPATQAPAAAKGGCGSSIAISALAIVAIA